MKVEYVFSYDMQAWWHVEIEKWDIRQETLNDKYVEFASIFRQKDRNACKKDKNWSSLLKVVDKANFPSFI